MSDKKKQLSKILREHYQVPEDIERLANLATSDLLWGPVGLDDDWERENYKGFQHACKRIQEYTEALPRHLYIDLNCEYVTTREPEGEEIDGEWCEPWYEDWYHVQGNEVIELIFNKYLVGYI
jgi:hypothetical protein